MAAIGDRVLGVERVEVDLEFGEQLDAALECGERRKRTAADVVVDAAPGERGPIHHRGYGDPARPDHLTQRLDAIEETGGGARGDAHTRRSHLDPVALLTRLGEL